MTPQPSMLRAWREGSHAFEDLQGWTTSDAMLQPPEGQAVMLHAATILPSLPRFAGELTSVVIDIFSSPWVNRE